MSARACVVQARMGSTRLPGKVLLPFHGEETILGILVDRLQTRGPGMPIIVATSIAPDDDAIAAFCSQRGVACHRGSEEDVLERFLSVASAYGLEGMIRICADNPFLDADFLDQVAGEAKGHDYVSHRLPGGLPAVLSHLGLFAEYVRTEALGKVARSTRDPRYREHVTRWIYENPEDFDIRWLDLSEELATGTAIRLTVDDRGDFDLARRIYGALSDEEGGMGWRELLAWIGADPAAVNAMRDGVERNRK